MRSLRNCAEFVAKTFILKGKTSYMDQVRGGREQKNVRPIGYPRKSHKFNNQEGSRKVQGES